MEPSKRKLAASLFAVAASAVLTTPLHAVTYTEPASDAGQTLATALFTGGNNTTPLTAINGTLSGVNDADLYYISIANASTFAASVTGNVDSALFLFSLSGTPIATNDDANGTNLNAAFAAGNSLYANLAAGRYLLGISGSGNEAVNSANQLLFAAYTNGDPTSTRGQAFGLNPATLFNFDNGGYAGNFGAYQINLTGVNTAVPEPSTWAAMVLGTVAAGFAFLRRRWQQA